MMNAYFSQFSAVHFQIFKFWSAWGQIIIYRARQSGLPYSEKRFIAHPSVPLITKTTSSWNRFKLIFQDTHWQTENPVVFFLNMFDSENKGSLALLVEVPTLFHLISDGNLMATPCTHRFYVIDHVLVLYDGLSGKSRLQQFPVNVAIMKFTIHMFLLAVLLAATVAAPASGIPKAPLVVTLSLSSDLKDIQADVTNTGADVSSTIALYNFLQLRSLLVT